MCWSRTKRQALGIRRRSRPHPALKAGAATSPRIDNPCAQSAIAIADGNSSDHDQVQAFEIAGGQASAASEPLAMPGTVTALWPAETRGQVTLVVRNSQTGDYEASRLGLACAQ